MAREFTKIYQFSFYIKELDDFVDLKLPEIYSALIYEISKGNVKRKLTRMFNEVLYRIYYSDYSFQAKFENLVCSQTIENKSVEDLIKAFDEIDKYTEIEGASTYDELGLLYAKKRNLIDEKGVADSRIEDFFSLGDFFATEVITHWVDGIFYADKEQLSAALEDETLFDRYCEMQAKLKIAG